MKNIFSLAALPLLLTSVSSTAAQPAEITSAYEGPYIGLDTTVSSQSELEASNTSIKLDEGGDYGFVAGFDSAVSENFLIGLELEYRELDSVTF